MATPLFLCVLPMIALAVHRRLKEDTRLAWKGDPCSDDSAHDLEPRNPFHLSVDPYPCRQHPNSATPLGSLVMMVGQLPCAPGRMKVAAYERAAAAE